MKILSSRHIGGVALGEDNQVLWKQAAWRGSAG